MLIMHVSDLTWGTEETDDAPGSQELTIVWGRQNINTMRKYDDGHQGTVVSE